MNNINFPELSLKSEQIDQYSEQFDKNLKMFNSKWVYGIRENQTVFAKSRTITYPT